MKRILVMLFAVAMVVNADAQDDCMNPDVNCDGFVNVNDLLGLLGYFGDEDLDGDGIWDSQDDCVCPLAGCTDWNAINFDPNAIEDDGSCLLDWLLTGNNIDGQQGFFGQSVSVNSNGSSMVIGAPYYTNGFSHGAVSVYDLIDSTWVQRGAEIFGTGSEQWGKALDISDDGNLIVIGVPDQNGGFGPGMVLAYAWIENEWVQYGNLVAGMENGDRFGSCVSLSSDGTRFVSGAPSADDVNGNNHGSISIYDWSGEEWVLIGDVIFGEYASDLFGSSVDISSDGVRIAAGAPFNDGNGNDRGHIRVFEQVEEDWVQIGADINGDSVFSNFGTSVSLSGNGLIVTGGGTACQACGNGSWGIPVRVFQYSDLEWNQLGSDITSDDANSMFGESLSLSHNGHRLVIGEPEYDALDQVGCGRARVFNFDLTDWQQVGGDIYGNESNVKLGRSVTITASGASFAVGSPSFNYGVGNGANAGGRVQFFSGN